MPVKVFTFPCNHLNMFLLNLFGTSYTYHDNNNYILACLSSLKVKIQIHLLTSIADIQLGSGVLLQEILGSVPEGFDSYFSSRFPRLLIEVYKVVSRHCKGEECFQKYFKAM